MFRRFWWLFPLSLVVFPVLGVILAGVVAYVQPKQFESRAVLQLRPVTALVDPSDSSVPSPNPNRMATELEVIRAAKTLDRVIDQLDLIARWGTDRDAARIKLRGMIEPRSIEGTDLIEIRVRASSPEDAKAIAEGVSRSYVERRTELETQGVEMALAGLRDEVARQEDRVEELRKALTQIIRGEALDSKREAAMQYAELEAAKIQLESQIDSLLRYDDEQLLAYAAGLEVPENIARDLYPPYLAAKRKLETLKVAGLGAEHPNVVEQERIIRAMRSDLDEGVVAIRDSLRAKLELAKEQLQRLREMQDESSQRGESSDLENADFQTVREEFESAQRLVEGLKLQAITGRLQQRVTDPSVIAHEDASVPRAPIAPKISQLLVLGAAGGFVVGLLAPLLLIPVMDLAIRPRESTDAPTA